MKLFLRRSVKRVQVFNGINVTLAFLTLLLSVSIFAKPSAPIKVEYSPTNKALLNQKMNIVIKIRPLVTASKVILKINNLPKTGIRLNSKRIYSFLNSPANVAIPVSISVTCTKKGLQYLNFSYSIISNGVEQLNTASIALDVVDNLNNTSSQGDDD